MNLRICAGLVWLGVCVFCMHAAGDRYFADYYHVPPSTEKAASMRLPDSWSPEYVSVLLRLPRPEVTFSTFSSGKVVLDESADISGPWQIAVGETIDLTAAQLFGLPVKIEMGTVYTVAFSSLDAAAVKLRVDLAGLRTGERLWMLSPQGSAVFGPFGPGNAIEGGTWLPTVFADTVVLLLEGTQELPNFSILGYAHFLPERFSKQRSILPCNIPVGCEADPVAMQIAAGVGLMLLPVGDNVLACSGSLLNAPAVSDHGTYFLSAEHCFSRGASLENLEVVWDFRGEGCSDEGASPPPESRTLGAEPVASNSVLDIRLIRLKEKPYVGPHGRTWIGWDTRLPETEDLVQNFHFPLASPMKTSRGRIRNTGGITCMDAMCSRYYEQQVSVLWTEGVTEPGSSGSPLLTRDGNFRILGVLSNGPLHSCSSTDGNTDNFGSFSEFFSQIGCRLIRDYACGAPYQAQSSSCCIARLMASSKCVENLRVFRDRVLLPTGWGKAIAETYYQTSVLSHAWVTKSPLVRMVAEGVITLGAAWGASL